MADRYGGNPAVDFSSLGDLGKVYKDAQLQAGRQRSLAALGQGASVADVSKLLFQSGDVEGGLSLARLADAQAQRALAQSNSARDFAFRQEEARRAQENANRSYGLQREQLNATLEGSKVPAGFTKTPEGGLAPIPGGPTDPRYLESATAARAKPRDFSVTDVTKLSEEGGKFANISTFADTFEPRFAGYKAPLAGSAAMTAGRYLPEGVVGKDISEGASWWQGYDRYKNVVRNELFGSALTKPEQSAFEKADISPGMDPEQIKRNLAIQKQISSNGLKRRANALIQSGYDPKAISAAYGLDLSEIGVTAQPRGKSQERAPASPAMPRLGEVRDGYRYKGGNPADPESWISLRAQ